MAEQIAYLCGAAVAGTRPLLPLWVWFRPGQQGLDVKARYRDRMASTSKIETFLAEPRNLVVAGIRRDGSPHLSPNWFYWDGERFYVSTTRHRAKYAIFRRDSRAELLVDDCTGHRAVLVRGTVEVREDIAAELPRFRRSATSMGWLSLATKSSCAG